MMTFDEALEATAAFDALSNVEQEEIISIERGRPDPERGDLWVAEQDEAAEDYATMMAEREAEATYSTHWYY